MVLAVSRPVYEQFGRSAVVQGSIRVERGNGNTKDVAGYSLLSSVDSFAFGDMSSYLGTHFNELTA